MLKLDVLFAPDEKRENSKERTSDPTGEPSNTDANDNESNPKGATQILLAFSVKRTGKSLLNFDNDDTTYQCIEGLKGLATIPLYLSMKLLTFGHLPFTNKGQLTKILNSPFSVFLRTSFLFMDVFLLASGLYAGYKFSTDFKEHNRIAWFRRIVARFIRLFPSMVAAILFTAWILPYIGNGPQWGPLIEQNAEMCRESLWKNIFFLQNFFPATEQCSPHLQQIAIDFQLFLVAPIIVYYLESNGVIGFGLFGALSAMSVAMRYSSALSERLSFVIFQGMKLSQFYRTLDVSFNSTVQRSTSYLIGLVLGVLLVNLRDVKRDIRIPKGVATIGWLSCVWSLFWCFWHPSSSSNKDFVYEPLDAAVYAAWAPLVWSLAMAWIIFMVFIESGGFLSRILTARPLVMLNRISYQLFFVQFLVSFYITASVRTADIFHLSSFINYTEISTIFVISTVSTMLFDLPFREISKMVSTIPENRSPDVDEPSSKNDIDDVDQNVVDPDVDEIWNNDSHAKVTFADNDNVDDDVYAKRSFTPVWKKLDDEKPVWGDDDDEADTVENSVSNRVAPSNPESEPEEEDEESYSEEEEEE